MQTGRVEGSSKDFREYLLVILARKWIVLLIFSLITAAAIYYAETSLPAYKAMSVLMREPDKMSASILGTMNPYYYYRGLWDFMEDMQRLMKSRSVAAEVAKRLSDDYNIDCSAGEVRGSVSLNNPERTNILEITATSGDPDKAAALANTFAQVFIKRTSEIKNADQDRAIEFLSEQLKLVDDKLRQSEEALNTFREKEGITTKADESGYGTSSLMANLGNLQGELSWVRSEKELVQAQLDSVRALIAEKENQLALTEEVDSLVGNVTPQIEQLQSKIADWQLELMALQETFTDRHYKVIELKQKIEEAQERLRSEITDLVAERSVNPISEWQSLVNQAVQLHVKLKGYEHREKLAASKVEEFEKEHPDLMEKEVQLVRLEREARIHEKTYMLLTDKYEETLLLKQVNTQEFGIVDDAIPPEYPIGPQKLRIITLGTLLGLILGVGAAFFIEYMDDSIKSREDVERYLGLSVVGSIPKIQAAKVSLLLPEATTDLVQDSSQALKKLEQRGNRGADAPVQAFGNPRVRGDQSKRENAGKSSPVKVDSRKRRNLKHKYREPLEALQGRLVTNAETKSAVIESYRSLWTNIQFISSVGKTVKTMLVTSPGPREGKSLTVANLALTVAQTGAKVLVIDTDLRRPTMHLIFGYRRSPGLSELIAGDLSNMGEIIKNTYAENVYILTCGDLPPNPVEVLGSEKMKQVIEEVQNRYDIVLLDSPPLIAMADTSVLATELGTTLLVLEAFQTKRHVANQAKELLQKLKVDISGVVLNNIDYSKLYSYYSYYHHYYYSYSEYYNREEEKDRRRLSSSGEA